MLRIGDENCILCSLCETRINVVKNVIVPETEIAVLGLGPGENEDFEGTPFVGRAGQKLKEALYKNGINPSDISYLNSVLCRPPNNKLKKDYIICLKYFEESLKEMPNIKIIMVLGVDAYKFITGKTKAAMSSIYSIPFKLEKYGDILFYPNYHPAALLYKPDHIIEEKFVGGFRIMKEMLEASKTITKKNNYKHILNPEHLDIALNVLKRQEFFSFDLETTSLVPHQAKILSFNFSWEEKTGIAFPYYYINNGNLEYFWEEEQRNKIIETLKEIFSSDVKVTTQNGKYDSLVLKHNFGFGIKIAFDTMLASFLLDSNQNFNLDSITAREIPEEAGVKSEFWNSINADEEQRKEDWYLKISLEDLLDYGIHDADVTYRLTKILARRLNNVE